MKNNWKIRPTWKMRRALLNVQTELFYSKETKSFSSNEPILYSNNEINHLRKSNPNYSKYVIDSLTNKNLIKHTCIFMRLDIFLNDIFPYSCVGLSDFILKNLDNIQFLYFILK